MYFQCRFGSNIGREGGPGRYAGDIYIDRQECENEIHTESSNDDIIES
jgi:hypothetical protein